MLLIKRYIKSVLMQLHLERHQAEYNATIAFVNNEF